MESIRANVDFTRHSRYVLFEVAKTILVRMTENAGTFPEPPVSMADLGALVEDYRNRLVARASNATADIHALGRSRVTLMAALAKLGGYVNSVAQGRTEIVLLSGFPSYSTARTPDRSPPAAPGNLRLEHGPRQAEVTVRFKPARSPSTNEVQLTTGDPNDEAGWRGAAIAKGQKAVLAGLVAGTHIWVRVRTLGLRGVMGDWSDPAGIFVA